MSVVGSVVSRAALGLALAAGISVARAEDFPVRPVKIIVQTAAGSSLDVMARLVAEPLSQMWGQQAIIVNQAGAGGLIASRALAASPADGYTLFLAGGSVFVVLPEVNNNLNFDVNEFVPIGFVAEQPYALLVSKQSGINSMAELIDRAKKRAGRPRRRRRHPRRPAAHDGGVRSRARSGVKLNMIHYPGAAQSSNDVIAGRVPMMMQTIAPVAGIVAAGEVKLLAIASDKRLPNYPDIPTVGGNHCRALPRPAGRSWWRRRARRLRSCRRSTPTSAPRWQIRRSSRRSRSSATTRGR